MLYYVVGAGLSSVMTISHALVSDTSSEQCKKKEAGVQYALVFLFLASDVHA